MTRNEAIEAEIRKLLPYAGDIVVGEEIIIRDKPGTPEDVWWSLKALANKFGTDNIKMTRTLEGTWVKVKDWTWSETVNA